MPKPLNAQGPTPKPHPNLAVVPETGYLIPPHVMGRNIDNPSEDLVASGRRLQKPRLGVKVPYRNLTSQIVTQDEIAQEILSRSLRRNPVQVTQEVGDVFFAMKLTQRLAHRLTSPAGSQDKILSAVKNLPTKDLTDPKEGIIPAAITLRDPSKTDGPAEASRLGDWHKPGGDEGDNSSHIDISPKLDPMIEREMALKQLNELPAMKKTRRRTKEPIEKTVPSRRKSQPKKDGTPGRPSTNNQEIQTNNTGALNKPGEPRKIGRKRKLENSPQTPLRLAKKIKAEILLHSEKNAKKTFEALVNGDSKGKKKALKKIPDKKAAAPVNLKAIKDDESMPSPKVPSEPKTTLLTPRGSTDQQEDPANPPSKAGSVSSLDVSVASSGRKRRSNKMRELDMLLMDEGAVNMLYEAEHGTTQNTNASGTRQRPSRARTTQLKNRQDLMLKARLVKNAVLRLSSGSTMANPVRPRARRKMEHLSPPVSPPSQTPSEPRSPTYSFAFPPKMPLAADASRIIRRHSSSSSFSSGSASPISSRRISLDFEKALNEPSCSNVHNSPPPSPNKKKGVPIFIKKVEKTYKGKKKIHAPIIITKALPQANVEIQTQKLVEEKRKELRITPKIQLKGSKKSLLDPKKSKISAAMKIKLKNEMSKNFQEGLNGNNSAKKLKKTLNVVPENLVPSWKRRKDLESKPYEAPDLSEPPLSLEDDPTLRNLEIQLAGIVGENEEEAGPSNPITVLPGCSTSPILTQGVTNQLHLLQKQTETMLESTLYAPSTSGRKMDLLPVIEEKMNSYEELVCLPDMIKQEEIDGDVIVPINAPAESPVDQMSLLCRVCACSNNDMIPIFGEENKELASKINTCLPIAVSQTDRLPLKICSLCVTRLSACHELMQCCSEADSKLRQILESQEEKQKETEVAEQSVESWKEESPEPESPPEEESPDQESYYDSSSDSDYVEKRRRVTRKAKKRFTCNLCKEFFNTKIQLSRHTEKEHDEYFEESQDLLRSTRQRSLNRKTLPRGTRCVLICSICKSVFTSKAAYTRHSRKLHNAPECKKCSLFFANKEELDIHKADNHVYNCNYCGDGFLTKFLLIVHIRSKHFTDKDKPSHSCISCTQQFSTKALLGQHIKMEHPDYREFTCDKCGKSYNNKKGFEVHLSTHQEERPFLCDICGKGFKHTNFLKSHKRCHRPAEEKNKICCSLCDKKFRGKSRLASHMRRHTGERPYQCQACTKTFFDQDLLNVHMKVHSGQASYDCQECGSRYFHKRNLADHMKRKHDAQPWSFRCLICGADFKSLSDVEEHCKNHTVKEISESQANGQVLYEKFANFQCKECSKSFSNILSLQVHARTHQQSISNSLMHSHDYQGSHAFECEICGKKTPNQPALTRHRRQHMGNSRFQCEICHKTFAQMAHLTQHRWIHTGEKPYKCQYCEAGFRSRNGLLVHERTHTGERPFKCKVCSKAFHGRGNLTTHMLRHREERRFKCPYCEKTFHRRGNLNTHVRVHTGERPYVCDICNRAFTQQQDMKKHRLSHFH